LFDGFLVKLREHVFIGNRRIFLISVVVFSASFLPFILYRRFWSDPPWYDEECYVSSAQACLRGDFSVHSEHPVVVKLFFALFIASLPMLEPFQAARLCSAMFGSLTCVLIYLFYKNKPSLISAFTLATFPIFRIYSGNALLESTLSFFVVLTSLFYIRFIETNKHIYLLTSAVSLGLAVASKYFGVILPIIIFLALLWSRNLNRKSMMYYCLWACIGCAVFLLTFALTDFSNLQKSIEHMIRQARGPRYSWYAFLFSFPLISSPFTIFFGLKGGIACFRNRDFHSKLFLLSFLVFLTHLTIQPYKNFHFMTILAPTLTMVMLKSFKENDDISYWLKTVIAFLSLHIYYIYILGFYNDLEWWVFLHMS